MSVEKKGHIGSSFSEFLKEEGLHDDANAIAIKRVLAWQLENAMSKEGMTKNEMAKRMHTSRSQLDRILDPDKGSEIYDLMAEGREQYGSQTFDQHLMDLVAQDMVAFEVAKAAANNPSDFELKVRTLA